jgi:hypothetical protein
MSHLPDNVKWTVKNNKLGNGYLNLIWYLEKLKDRSFFSALVNEPVSRKYARIFGSGAYRSITSTEGFKITVPEIRSILNLSKELEGDTTPDPQFESYMRFVCSDLENFYNACDGAVVLGKVDSNRKEKPVSFFQGLSMLGNLSISSSEYVSYVREPEGYKLLGKRVNPYREVETINMQLKLMGFETSHLSNDQLAAVVRKFSRDEQRSFRLVMPLPGESRRINSYVDAIKTLSYNSMKWKTFDIRARNAAIVDWSRKLVNGKLPETVIDYLRVS